MKTPRARSRMTVLAAATVFLAAATGLGALCGQPQKSHGLLAQLVGTPSVAPAGGNTPVLQPPDATATATRLVGLEQTAAAFDEFPIVWLGPSYHSVVPTASTAAGADLPLRSAAGEHDPGLRDPRDGTPIIPAFTDFALSYGDCQIPPGATGCGVPVGISIYPPDSPVISANTD